MLTSMNTNLLSAGKRVNVPENHSGNTKSSKTIWRLKLRKSHVVVFRVWKYSMCLGSFPYTVYSKVYKKKCIIKRLLGILVGTNDVVRKEDAHTYPHTVGLLFRRKPIVRSRDRWRGQVMSEEVKQKQAEDCFLHLSLLHCLETPMVSALRQGTTFQLRE